MSKLLLQRFLQDDRVTLGKLHLLWVKSHPDIYTLELPWKNNQRSISCIPAGVYELAPHNSQKYPETWQLLNVPNRTGILIHIGNYTKNTNGCILPGFGINEDIPMVERSGAAMEYLRNMLGYKNLLIEVQDA